MTTTPSATDTQALVQRIAQELGETQRVPIGQIRRIVQHLGTERALAFLEETRQVEAQGGMLLPDGSRRRTPGGVFFSLVKERLSTADRTAIFPVWPGKKRPMGTATPAQPAAPVAISELPSMTGEVRTVKITLIGRPGPTTATRGGYIMTSMQNTKVPSLPKGLPAPPSVPTSYTVYIAPKQWNSVAAALRDPADLLIVEGWPTYDPALEGIAVFATNVTTKVLQQAKRAA